MRKLIILMILALADFFSVNAQYTFTISVSWSGQCGGYTAQINQVTSQYRTQAINGFPTRELCEQTRAMCHQELGHIELIWYDVNTGREIKREATNCKLNVTTTPCSGHPIAGSAGSLNPLGVSQGTSFYNSNTVNEIQNWSEDDAARRMALDAGYTLKTNETVATGDHDFDDIIESMPFSNESFSGRMPRGSNQINTNGNIVYIGQPVKGNGVSVSDDFFNKPFEGTGEWHSDDLKPINVNLKPVPNGVETFDEEGWNLWRDGLKLGKEMGMFVYGVAAGASTLTVATAGLLGDANINLWTELYKAKRKIDLDEAYEAPNNILTESAVYWGGEEYAIVGNVLYNALSSTVNDFVELVAGIPKDYVKGKVVDEVRNKALTEGVAGKLPDTGNIVGLGNIAVDSYNFGGDLYHYLKERK